MTRSLRGLCIGLPLALSAATAAGAAGCTSTSSPVIYTPITGIVVRSSQLVAGHGCGTGPDQVYAYAAILSYANGPGPGCTPTNEACQSIITQCYADAVLSNLQPRVAGGQDYDFVLHIYAYNYQSFPPALACTPPRPNRDCPGDYLSATTDPDASDIEPNPSYPPNWETTCTATEEQGIPVLADCLPLEPHAPARDAGGGAG